MLVGPSGLKVSLPGTLHGQVADTDSFTLLTALVGPAWAKWILLAGLPISSQQALQWNLLDWVVKPEQLDIFAMDLAATLARRPPVALASQKTLIDAQYLGEVKAGVSREMAAQLALAGTRHA